MENKIKQRLGELYGTVRWFLQIGAFTTLGAIGAYQFNKSENYVGNNYLFERVESIEKNLNAEHNYQYKNIENLCAEFCERKDSISNLIAEKDSLKLLLEYSLQNKETKKSRRMRKIPYGTLMFLGLIGVGYTLLNVQEYLDEDTKTPEEQNWFNRIL